MSDLGPEYHGQNRFPKLQPKGICRGCRRPITEKNRITWCSHECHQKYDPAYVKYAVRNRDGEKCVFCGKDCSRQAQWLYRKTAPNPPHYERDCRLEYPYDFAKYHSHPVYLEYVRLRKEWKRNSPKPEYDHIIPHSEGGLFVLENIRLLCRACHLQRTKEWRKEKAKITSK